MAKLRPKILGTYAGTEGTRADILDATELVLRQEGHAACSVRRVAAECGLSSGNLSYHFATKRDLFEATIKRVLERYQAKLTQMFEKETLTQAGSVRPLVEWLVRDAADPDLRALMLEFWAMSKIHRFADEAIKNFYAELVQVFVVQHAMEHAPMDEKRLTAAGYLLASISEGTTILFSPTCPPNTTLDDHVNNACIAFDAVWSELTKQGKRSS